jgi:tRNA pseudouridine38-40 synthase
MPFFYKLTIAYNGSKYLGWQQQPCGQTVQDRLNLSLAKITKSDQIKSIGSGRTDAGVHASGQVVRVEIPFEIKSDSLLKAINSHLPRDIRVLSSEECEESFHPIFSAQSKWYSYYFTISEYEDPLVGDLLSHCGFKLDLELMKKACKVFEGKHDFMNFYTEGTEVKSTIREIYSCDLIELVSSQEPFPCYGPVYEIRIHGTGFLKQMVRMIVGALWGVGRGKISAKDIEKAFLTKQKERLGVVAPPNGLYLTQVVYDSN